MEDLAQLNTYRTRRAEIKHGTGPANNSEVDLLNISSGAGIVNYVWLADCPGAGGGWPEYDHRIRVYTDGNNTPDIDMDLGLFFGYAYGEIFPAGNISTRYWSNHNSGNTNTHRVSGAVRLPMPFSNGIRICIANVNNTPQSVFFSQVEYRTVADNSTMTVPAYRLNVCGNAWSGNRQNVGSGTDATLATICAGNPGVIVGHSMAMGNANDYSYLERYIGVYIDGETSPSIKSSGTEDWFTGSYYNYSGDDPKSNYGAMAYGPQYESNTNPCGYSALVDLLALNGGLAFTSSATVKWLTNSGVGVSSDYGSCVFYYRHT